MIVSQNFFCALISHFEIHEKIGDSIDTKWDEHNIWGFESTTVIHIL